MDVHRAMFNYEYVYNMMEQGIIKDINTVHEFISGATCLHIAAMNNDKKLVDYLLQKQADVNLKSEFWGTALHIAVMEENLAITESLINYGAGVNTQLLNATYYTPLQLAVEQNNKDIAEFLIKNGADVNAVLTNNKSEFIQPPLHLAIEKGNEGMVELLLQNNADLNIDVVPYGKPLDVAIREENLEIVKLLLAYGADIKDSTDYQFGQDISLHVAVSTKNLKVVELLLSDPTIDVNIVSNDGNSVLHDGVEYGCSIIIINHLLDAGVDINLKNNCGETVFDRFHVIEKDALDTLQHYVVKLSAASLYVSDENLARVNKKKYNPVREKCMKEIEQMKHRMIGSFTLYDLLHKSEYKLAAGLKHIPNNIILSWDFQSIFPLYGGMVAYRLKRALGRKNLLLNVSDLVYAIFNNIQLPRTFTKMIFDYLTNTDLKKLDVSDDSQVDILIKMLESQRI
ncbi:putative ankyrin repeat protein RF_0381 [Microplitis mediator]|uniref:putative ankyrin repeat protein RF_0381 n=1 Tax=Microplitis mediator TaxID=375433 RepID=UPI002552BB13|nr:putative ankyrin repeat protein RF_0381 [Microplitis mediator]